MTGTDGDDYIRGGVMGPGDGTGRFTDDNGLFAGAGNDTLETGASDWADWQYLEGQGGDDTYLIGSDGGLVLIDYTAEAAGGTDTVRFKDLSLSDMTVTYHDHGNSNGEALRFDWVADGDRPAGQLHIADKGNDIERFEFADGVTLKRIHIDGIGRAILSGTGGDDYIKAGVTSPGDGSGRYSDDNVIWAGAGDDTLETGASGWADYQVLSGQSGNDTYLIGSDSGSTIIQYDAEVADGGTDTVRFKDLFLSDLTISYHDHGNSNGEALRFSWQAEGGRPAGQFHIANKAQHIERFEFADGTSLSEINVRTDDSSELIGTTDNDRISETSGIDHLTGGQGSDTFVFSENSGNDHVTDFTNGEDLIHIESGASVFSDLILAASGSDSLVQFGGTTITLDGVQLADLDQGDFLFS
ncbi:Haemolysin-type calcium binding protein related domain protein [Roseibium album]|nr:Haemolysin-type calcium binding protein related domain protein [Roseibium album]